MVKSYLIDGKSISSNPRYWGTALKAISRFGESRSSYCTWSLVTLLAFTVAGPHFTVIVCSVALTKNGRRQYNNRDSSDKN